MADTSTIQLFDRKRKVRSRCYVYNDVGKSILVLILIYLPMEERRKEMSYYLRIITNTISGNIAERMSVFLE